MDELTADPRTIVSASRRPFWFGLALALALSAAFGNASAAPQDWPQFRGPDGNGSTSERNLPLHWSETDHIKWKTAIHGRAWSSPVIGTGQIWLTTATEDGRQLTAVCVEQESGKVLNDIKLFDVQNPQFAHKFNTYGSPTPVLEGGKVYVTFGSPGTACLDTSSGKVLWERRDFVCNHFRGAGSSPILYRNLLLMNFDGSDHQFVVALDKDSGKTVWRQERSLDYKDLGPDGKPKDEGDWRKAFATPHVGLINGIPTFISQGAKAAYGYEALTGKELWRVEERTSHSGGGRPVLSGDGLVYITSGWSSGQLLALRVIGPKASVLDVNAETNAPSDLQLVWRTKRNVPKKPSLQLAGELLFAIDDGGIASCLDAKTGQEIWRERVGGNYSASPLLAGERLYFFSEEGKTTIIEAGRTFKKLAENTLEDGFMASPAVAGKALYLRTRTNLYRIEE